MPLHLVVISLLTFVFAAPPKPVYMEPSSSPCRRLTGCQCPRASSSSSSPCSWPQARWAQLCFMKCSLFQHYSVLCKRVKRFYENDFHLSASCETLVAQNNLRLSMFFIYGLLVMSLVSSCASLFLGKTFTYLLSWNHVDITSNSFSLCIKSIICGTRECMCNI